MRKLVPVILLALLARVLLEQRRDLGRCHRHLRCSRIRRSTPLPPWTIRSSMRSRSCLPISEDGDPVVTIDGELSTDKTVRRVLTEGEGERRRTGIDGDDPRHADQRADGRAIRRDPAGRAGHGLARSVVGTRRHLPQPGRGARREPGRLSGVAGRGSRGTGRLPRPRCRGRRHDRVRLRRHRRDRAPRTRNGHRSRTSCRASDRDARRRRRAEHRAPRRRPADRVDRPGAHRRRRRRGRTRPEPDGPLHRHHLARRRAIRLVVGPRASRRRSTSAWAP